MNWEVIGVLAEITGAIAVVASLVYVGRQFKHSSTYSLENIFFQTGSSFVSTPENASVITRGNRDYLSLSDDEKQHYVMMLHNLFSAIEVIYLQHQRRLIHRESAIRVLRVAHFYINQPGFKVAWNGVIRHYLDRDFVNAVESHHMIDPIPATDITLGDSGAGK